MTTRRGLAVSLALCLLCSFSAAGHLDAAQAARKGSDGSPGAVAYRDQYRGLPAPPAQPPLGTVDVDLPSLSTGSESGTLAVRVQSPQAGYARYPDGAPVIIWLPGGFELKGLAHELPPQADDVIIVTFGFPGDPVPNAAVSSDGEYDYRGERSIQALRDIVLYAAGELQDSEGSTIDEVVRVDVLHDNVGLIGVSNGGNIIVAVAALHGSDLSGRLRYLIQWETPVSSQIATRDFGRVWMKPSAQQGDFFNPRYGGYGPLLFPVDYSDLAYDPSQQFYPLFHDGNGDGLYSTVQDPASGRPTPDLDGDGALGPDEDFPLDTYPDGELVVYSRPVMHALVAGQVLPGGWVPGIVTPERADAYWDIRESVRLYHRALAGIPDLEGMVLCSVEDHVQSAPDKPHIRQAFEGWHENGGWVQINPSPAYVLEVDSGLEGSTNLPANDPGSPPGDWADAAGYAMPEEVVDGIYQLAAVYEMADRAHEGGSPSDASDEGPSAGQGWADWCPGSVVPVALVAAVAFVRLDRRRSGASAPDGSRNE
jgi:hypothetical protein